MTRFLKSPSTSGRVLLPVLKQAILVKEGTKRKGKNRKNIPATFLPVCREQALWNIIFRTTLLKLTRKRRMHKDHKISKPLHFLRLNILPETKHYFLLKNSFLLLLWWLFDGVIFFSSQDPVLRGISDGTLSKSEGSRAENGEINTSPYNSYHLSRRKK